MIIMVRVDDRLLHGQIICAWVPFVKADALIVASDEAASDDLVSDIICSCGYKGLSVYVKKLDEAARYAAASDKQRAILIVGEIQDALRIYESGMRFDTVNLGNIHHEDNGRAITPYVIVNEQDEAVMRRFEELGVKIDIRDVPASEPVDYVPVTK